MRKIVPVHRKKRSFQKIFWKEETLCREKEKKLLGSKNGSFLEGSSLKEKFRKLALYVRDQVILLKIA